MNGLLKIAILGMVVGLSFGFVFGYVPVQVQLFKQAIQNQNQVTNCANCDFRGVQELTGVDAHGAHMPGVTFQPCSPTSINKDNQLMICIPDQISDLIGINLANANLFSSCFDYVDLDGANLSGADFTNSSVQNSSLNNAKVAGIITTNASFCNSVMPDGTVCKDTWTGQGVTIQCNCFVNTTSASTSSTSQTQTSGSTTTTNSTTQKTSTTSVAASN